MPVDHRAAGRVGRAGRGVAALAVLVSLAVAGAGCAAQPRSAQWSLPKSPSDPQPATQPASPSAAVPVPTAPSPPAKLPVIDYNPAPKGFPADPEPLSTAALTEGARPTARVALYDAPGGQARAYLDPTISGVPVTTPIVTRRAGWAAVLLPSANRTVGWLPPSDAWTSVPLRDQLVVRRAAHQLTWYRDGALQRSWTVTIGSSATPTPLGRTFVLGRSRLPGVVYAGVDVLALGSVPDRPDRVATGLRGAHIGIHGWYRDDFGANKSNGCVRVPKAAQQLLLDQTAAGVEVVVVD